MSRNNNRDATSYNNPFDDCSGQIQPNFDSGHRLHTQINNTVLSTCSTQNEQPILQTTSAFVGHSLSSACSNILKTVLNNKKQQSAGIRFDSNQQFLNQNTGNNNFQNVGNTQNTWNTQIPISTTNNAKDITHNAHFSLPQTADLQQVVVSQQSENINMVPVAVASGEEEEEEESDICSLPECDSDLLEVNGDAPHIDETDETVENTANSKLNTTKSESFSNALFTLHNESLGYAKTITQESNTNSQLSSFQNRIDVSNASPKIQNSSIAKNTANLDNEVKLNVTKQAPTNVKSHPTTTSLPSTVTMTTPSVKKINNSFPQDITPFLLMQKMLRGETDLHLPSDPKSWSKQEVSEFLKWLVQILKTDEPLIDYDKFQIDGKLLFKIRKRNLQKLFPGDCVDSIWMHVEALKFASVTASTNLQSSSTTENIDNNPSQQQQQQKQSTNNVNQTSSSSSSYPTTIVNQNLGPANRAKINNDGYSSPGSGQIQLWQFLLEILTERNMSHIISWVGDEGAFKLVDPEKVAQLWGERKNKPSMNYEKLSRALRYYYDGDLIHKVCGKRFVYQFVCDLKMLLGYSAAELSRLVNETSRKDQND